MYGSDWLNAVSVCHETAEVEMCAVVKAYFSADFDVHSDISDAEALENSSNQSSSFVRYANRVCNSHRSPLSGVKYDPLFHSRHSSRDRTLTVGHEINQFYG